MRITPKLSKFRPRKTYRKRNPAAVNQPAQNIGTDDVGSDVLCRLIHGSRISLSVGFVAVGISTIFGIIIGAILGYFGGKVDFLGMRIVEIMMAVPTFFLIITIVAFFPRSLFNIMVIIGITGWTARRKIYPGGIF